MSTLKAVAKLANVSVSTVSKYLNDDIKVREDTKSRIETALIEANYTKVPKQKRHHSKSIAIILPEIANTKFSVLVSYMLTEAMSKGYTVMTFTTKNSSATETIIVDEIIQLGVAGAILITEPQGKPSEENLQRLKKAGVAVVTVNRDFYENKHASVCSDYYNSIKDVLYHFYSNGYRKIGLMLGWEKQSGNTEIFRAVKEVSEELDFDANIMDNIYYTDYNKIKYRLALEYFRNKGVNAVFTINDLMALELLKSMKAHKLHYPEDMALIALTDNDNFDLLDVSALDTDSVMVAKISVKAVFDILAGNPVDKYQVIRTKLVNRSSSMPKHM